MSAHHEAGPHWVIRPAEMSARERMAVAMRLGQPDRVPVMCQLSLGHYFLHAGLDPVDIWHGTPEFGEALLRLRARYGFDGILVNLPGRDPEWRQAIARRERVGTEVRLTWRNGLVTVVPQDDNPHVYQSDGRQPRVRFEKIDPDLLFYVEPHDLTGVSYPYVWGVSAERAVPGPDFFPPWTFDTIRWVVARGGQVSVHGEVFSPLSQLMELTGYEEALLVLATDACKVSACLDRLTTGAIALALGQIAAGADAVLISSAFAGAPFLSRAMYETFELRWLRRIADAIHAGSHVPVYVHTCGAIGDRLDLMMAASIDGIDTLDPPPLGTIDLAEACRQTKGRVFLKGNVDPVNELLAGTPESVCKAARDRIEVAAAGGGYILSTACSVPPAAPPANIVALRDAVERFGQYR